MAPRDSRQTEAALLRAAHRAVLRRPPAASSAGARAVMQANKKRDTGPELLLRRELHRRGLRFRVAHPIRVDGFRPIRPDVVFTRWSLAVFVDGCFWHGCLEHGTSPRANAGYWTSKIAINRDRDERQTAALTAAGWTVLRVWEHEEHQAAADRVVAALELKRALAVRQRG